MHVVMLSDLETQGGAATAASRLAEGLIKAGVRVTRLLCYPDGRTHPWRTQLLRGRLWERFAWRGVQLLSESISMRLANYSQMVWIHRTLDIVLSKLRPDVINVDNLHAARWWPSLVAVCSRHAPTVWTLHDMWSFTGRCAYSYDCRKFTSGCDAYCPTPNEYPALAPKLIADSWKLRWRLFVEHLGLVAVCASNWLAREALVGLWKGHRIEVIPYGLPLEIYKPFNKNSARSALGMNTQTPMLLTCAQDLQERRKGGAILVKALQKLSHGHVTLLTMGHGSLSIKSEAIYSHPIGYIDDEQAKVMVYNAADLLVHPAPIDNFPLAVMEAIACGTPVVGLPIGGVLDMVRPGQTGWLAQEATPNALAKAIDIAIQDINAGVDLAPTCRAIAESEYGIELQVRRYLRLFRSLGVSDSA